MLFRSVQGLDASGRRAVVELTGPAAAIANPAFDVTPSHLVTGLITERGITEPAGLEGLFPERSGPR